MLDLLYKRNPLTTTVVDGSIFLKISKTYNWTEKRWKKILFGLSSTNLLGPFLNTLSHFCSGITMMKLKLTLKYHS